MGEAIGAVLALAIGIGVSPIPLIAIVAVLFSARSKANGTVFLTVWFGGLGAIGATAFLIADALDVGADAGADEGVGWIRLAGGLLLFVAAARAWRSRPRAGERASPPAWMSGLDQLTTARTAALAAGLSVNPKNLLLAGTAGVGLAETAPTTASAVVALGFFAAVGSAPVAVAVAYRAFGGDGATARLDRVRTWLEQHNATVVAIVFAVLGGMLIVQGSGVLSG